MKNLVLQPTPIHLQVGLSRDVICYDLNSLSFSWTLPCGGYQTAYRLSVKSGDMGEQVFDSLWIETNQNTAVTPQGLAEHLYPNHLYTCQVAVKYTATDTSEEIEAPFSPPIVFVTAPRIQDATGLWAGEDLFAFLRREFTLSPAMYAQMSRAVLTVTAASPEPARQYVYHAYLDGQSLGMGPTRLDKDLEGQDILYFQSYDVTYLLSEGTHGFGAVCYTAAEKAFYACLTVYDHRGNPTVIFDTQSPLGWQALPGDEIYRPDHSIGTHYFVAHACNIDGTRYPHGFAEAGYHSVQWVEPTVRGNIAQNRFLMPSPTANLQQFLSPTHTVKVTETDTGSLLIDLGREIVGGFRLTLPCTRAVEITLRYGEELTPEGHVLSPMRTGNHYLEKWILSPHGLPLSTLSLMTFRYVEITDCPLDITPDMVQGLEFRLNHQESAADFACDHPLLNRIWDLVKHTVKVTTQELYVDSQSRERTAYEGDLLINLMAAYACGGDLSTGRFTTRYLCTHRTWPAEYPLFVILSAWEDYMATGDISFLKAYAPRLETMVFTDYLHEDVDLIASPSIQSSQMNGVLVDWPKSERDGYDMEPPYNTVFNAICVSAYEALAHIFSALGDPVKADTYAKLGARIREAMIARLYDPARGAFFDGCDKSTVCSHQSQHATAFCLASGIYDSSSMKAGMAGYLKSQGEIRMSVYGSYFLLKGLYATGYGEIANRLLLSEDTSEGARTWAYMLDTLGATVTTEAWNRENKPNMTYSHPWGAAPAHMILSGIMGITPRAPGYREFDIRPCAAGWHHARIKHPTVKGDIILEIDADTQTYDVVVPFNTTARLYLPEGNGEREICLPSGTHHIS